MASKRNGVRKKCTIVTVCTQFLSCVSTLTHNSIRAPGLQLDNEVSQSTDQPRGTVCHQHCGRWTCRRSPSCGHWRRTCSGLPSAIETFSWFWRQIQISSLTHLLTYWCKARRSKNGFSYCHVTFRIEWQWLRDHASKFTRWQHLAVVIGRGLIYMA